jgi:hypothetical protein
LNCGLKDPNIFSLNAVACCRFEEEERASPVLTDETPHPIPAEPQTQLRKVAEAAIVDTIMRHLMLQVSIVNATSKTRGISSQCNLSNDLSLKVMPTSHKQSITFRVQLDDYLSQAFLLSSNKGGRLPLFGKGMLLSWRSADAKFWHEDFLKMLNMLKTDVRVWVREKKGRTARKDVINS